MTRSKSAWLGIPIALLLATAALLYLSRPQEVQKQADHPPPHWLADISPMYEQAQASLDAARLDREQLSAAKAVAGELEHYLEGVVPQTEAEADQLLETKRTVIWMRARKLEGVVPWEETISDWLAVVELTELTREFELQARVLSRLARVYLQASRWEELRVLARVHGRSFGGEELDSATDIELVYRADCLSYFALAYERMELYDVAEKLVEAGALALEALRFPENLSGRDAPVYLEAGATLAQARFRIAVSRVQAEEASLAVDLLEQSAERLGDLADELEAADQSSEQVRMIERNARGRWFVARVQFAGTFKTASARDLVARIESGDAWPDLPLEVRAEILHLNAMFAGVEVENTNEEGEARARLVDDWRAQTERLLDLPDLSPEVRGAHLRRAAEFGVRTRSLEDAVRYAGLFEEHRKGMAEAPDSPSARLAECSADAVRLGIDRLRGLTEAELQEPLARALEAFRRFVEASKTVEVGTEGATPFWYAEVRFVLRELVAGVMAVDAANAPESALEVLLLAQEMGAVSRRRSARTSSADQVRALLEPREHGMLFFLVLGSGGYIFALDREGVIVQEYEGHDDVARWARSSSRRLRSQEDRDEALLRGELEALSDILLPPAVMERILGWSRLTIVGEDNLRCRIPFELLPVTDGQPLWRTHAIDHLASTHLGHMLAEAQAGRTKEAGKDTLVVSGALPSDAAVRLSRTAKPLGFKETRVRTFAGNEARILWGSDANEAQLWKQELGRIRVLQFFVHGIADGRRQSPAGLVLTPSRDSRDDDGVLWTDEIAEEAERRWPGEDYLPPFVILTACRSGEAVIGPGEDGTVSLAGAWLWGGSQAVLEARYDLEVEFALELSRLLHEELKRDDARPASVLRRVRLRLDEGKPYADPYYHAGLRIIGLGQRPLR